MSDDARADVGVIGLAVMGQNLVLNLNDQGTRVAVYNRTREVTDGFLRDRAEGREIVATYGLEAFASALRSPRRVLLMVKAGDPVDAVLDALVPLLDEGDVVMDGGNSHYEDTRRREADLRERGIRFLGVGISGGEEGARHGPSLMPGGDRDAYEEVAPLLEGIAARAPDGDPCVTWLGEDGAGHFVKMVHNGIEYGDMQLIAESYQLMKDGLGLTNEGMQGVFEAWNEGPLDSFLIQITAEVLGARGDDGAYLVDRVVDAAGQKGTGRWTAITALEQGIPLTVVDEAVAARSVSSAKEERRHAEELLSGPDAALLDDDAEAVLSDLHDALYASKIVAYAQGISLLRAAARAFDWSLDPADAAAVWRAGCIIRSRFLGDITEAFRSDPELTNLLLAPFFAAAVQKAQDAWRRTIQRAVGIGVATPAMSAALAYYDGYRRGRGPANLIQAQRDRFGAHGVELIDGEPGETVHLDWSG